MSVLNDDLIVNVPNEFSFEKNLHYMQRSANECMYQVYNNCIVKIIPFTHTLPLVEISELDDGNLNVKFLEERFVDEHTRLQVSTYIIDWFDLETNLTPFYEMAKNDPILHDIVTKQFGLRIIGIDDLFETIVWAILGQQINLTFAYTLKKRFVETFGTSKQWDGHTYWKFPEAKEVSQLTVDDLTALQITKRKSEYIIGVANLIADGSLSKQQLRNVKVIGEAEKILTAIRGVGPWTANYVLMRCLRFPNAFPLADIGLQNALKHVLKTKEKLSASKIREIALPWQGWEAYATFYLWRVLY